MSNDHDPRRHFGGRPEQPDEPADEATFRLGDPARGPGAGAGEPTRATVLDPDSWSSEVPYAVPQQAPPYEPAYEPPYAPALDKTVRQPPEYGATGATGPTGPTTTATTAGGLRRFGPGVPGPDTSAGTAHTAAVWHGTVRPGDPVIAPVGSGSRRRRALRSWLLPVLVLLAVVAYLVWQRMPHAVEVNGVAVANATAVQGCHSTAKVVGILRTSGGAGTVRYRWHRSDGTVSDELTQHVSKGHRSTDVVLLWTFDGPGSLTATATLEVLAPQHKSGSTTFAYRCK